MFRKIIGAALIALVVTSAPVWAQGQSPQTPASKSGSGKRVAWILIGAGAGFAAGMFLGLNAFDDAVDSDRKVWTSALVGAGGGGVAAALLTRNVGRQPSPGIATSAGHAALPNVSWESAIRGRTTLHDLSRSLLVRRTDMELDSRQ